ITMPDAVKLPGAVTGAVAIDLGWRQMGDALRVATWQGENGKSGELRLDARLLSELHKPEELRSLRDEKFNVALASLVAGLGTLGEMPEWMRMLTVRRGTPTPSKAQALAYLSGWRSAGRL